MDGREKKQEIKVSSRDHGRGCAARKLFELRELEGDLDEALESSLCKSKCSERPTQKKTGDPNLSLLVDERLVRLIALHVDADGGAHRARSTEPHDDARAILKDHANALNMEH